MKWGTVRVPLIRVLDIQMVFLVATLALVGITSSASPREMWLLTLAMLKAHGKLGVSHNSANRDHEMKVRLNAYLNPQAGLIGRVIYFVLVSAFLLHAKSSSVLVSAGHRKQSTQLYPVKDYLVTSWCRYEKINIDLNSCLYLFSSWWLEKQNLLWEVVLN